MDGTVVRAYAEIAGGHWCSVRGLRVGVLIARYLPLLLLVAGALILLLTGRPLFSDGALSAKQNTFKSLAVASPMLEALIGISVIGKPFLEQLQKNGWQSDLLGPTPLLVLVTIFVVSLYAMIGGILFFFYRAIRNINFFSGRRMRAPFSALFMAVPIVNLVVIPYVQYFAYQRSRAFAWPQHASALGAALLVTATFGLLLVSVICGYAGEDSEGALYDAASLLVIGTLTGLAGGILQARMVDGIARAQEAHALQVGALGSARTLAAAKPESRARKILQSLAVGVLVLLAALAALDPPLASQVGHLFVQLLRGA